MRNDPESYRRTETLPDGTLVEFRPITAQDRIPMVRFHNILSERTVTGRYLQCLSFAERIQHNRLEQVCQADFVRELVYLVVLPGAGDGVDRVIAVGRIDCSAEDDNHLMLVVADAWQDRGVGGLLLRFLIDLARREGMRRLKVRLHTENLPMRHLCREVGFFYGDPRDADDVVEGVLDLAHAIDAHAPE